MAVFRSGLGLDRPCSSGLGDAVVGGGRGLGIIVVVVVGVIVGLLNVDLLRMMMMKLMMKRTGSVVVVGLVDADCGEGVVVVVADDGGVAVVVGVEILVGDVWTILLAVLLLGWIMLTMMDLLAEFPYLYSFL